MGKQTYFNPEWTSKPEYKHWLKPDKKACCTKCHTTINLGNMGIAALNIHAKGDNHKRNCKTPQLFLGPAPKKKKIVDLTGNDESKRYQAKPREVSRRQAAERKRPLVYFSETSPRNQMISFSYYQV